MSLPLTEAEKYPLDEPQVVDVLSDADYRKLDKRVTRKIDLHILPWIIVCEYPPHTSHMKEKIELNLQPIYSIISIVPISAM